MKSLLFIFIALICLPVSSSYGEVMSSKELIERADLLDGKAVSYSGEVVTAIMKRGEHSWVNLNDGENAIGVWCENSMLEGVKFIGDYKFKGDILEVEGKFNRACSIHRGDLDIHATSIKIIKIGYPVAEKVDTAKLKVAGALFLAILPLLFFFKKRM